MRILPILTFCVDQGSMAKPTASNLQRFPVWIVLAVAAASIGLIPLAALLF